MKSKGFMTIYLLPIFLSIIVVSTDVLQSVTASYRVTNNFLGREMAEYLSDIGLKHGIKLSNEEVAYKNYYINLIDNSIKVSEKHEGDQYTKVNIKVKEIIDSKEVIIESISRVGNYSHRLNYSYVIYSESLENNVDNSLENLDTKK